MIKKLYETYYEELLRFAVHLTHSTAAAEDIVQETYIRAIGNADVLEDMGDAKCRAWLYRTARNLFIDQFRKEKHMADVMAGEAAASAGFSEDDLSMAEVGQMIKLLSAKDRSMFWMRYMEGYNATELGEIFNLPPGTVRSRLALARQKISSIYYKSIR